MKIAVFSGSFDPIHCGHAMMANYIGQFCDIDRVWLMPSPLNPLKLQSIPSADFCQRMEMCRIVARKCLNVEVSDFEASLPSPSFSYKTLCALRDAYPEHSFRLVIGSDNWLCFDRWKDPEKIIREFGLIVYPRPGYEISGRLPDNVILLPKAPVALISSSFIRKAIHGAKNLNYFLDAAVLEYISSNHLYV